MPFRNLCVMLPISLLACAAADTRDAATVRDSAGVRIVENPLEPGDIGWRLAEAPDVAIGVLEGPPEEQLFRVVGARRIGDRIVVANAGTSELRFFDESGRFLSATGGEGDGPGEFRGLGGIYRYGPDSLLVYDFSLRRLSIFGADGVHARSVQLPPIGDVQYPQLAGLFGDGTLFVRTGRVFGPGGVESGLNRDPITLFRLTIDGTIRDTLGEFPGGESFVETMGDGFMVMPRAFGRSPASAAHGDRFYYGASDTYEIAVHAGNGTLEQLVRLAHENRPVTPEYIADLKQRRLDDIEDDNARRRFESLYEAMPFPHTMPAYSGLRIDSEDHLWVQDYLVPGEETNRWTVFNAQGQLVGHLDLPPRFNVYEIGRDYVLGRRVDELDVEHVELYSLVRFVDP